MLEILNDWRLSRKMLVAFGLIGIATLSLGATTIISNGTIDKASNRLVTGRLPTILAMTKIMGHLREYRIIMYAHVTAASPKEADVADQRAVKNRDALQSDLAELHGVMGPELSEEFARLKNGIATLEAVNSHILALSRQHRSTEAAALMKKEGVQQSRAMIGEGENLIAKASRNAEQDGADASAFANKAFYLMAIMVLLSLGFLAFVWRTLDKTVSQPMAALSSVTAALAGGREATVPHCDRGDELGEIAKAVEMFRVAALARREADRKLAQDQELVTSTLRDNLAALAQGDLTAEVKVTFPEASATLKDNFNEALGRLREMIGSVSESATGIRTGSTEIAQAAEDLARRTEGNAASLEQTSAALVQIDDRLKSTASAAGRTVARADQAITTVSSGRAIADEAVQAMERVRESATGIDSVIEGLDKIAFQTRVLAMNAAVEAGRAGDAGRGFAVVADLVSSLAMRAEEEAKRARDQLTVTQTDIGAAVQAVRNVDSALADISGDVGEVHTLLGSMATDNQAQSSAISQISVAISAMDQSTQQNAAMVEETSAAARNLTAEVASLAEQAALFKVHKGSRAAAPGRKTAKAPMERAAPPTPYLSPVKPRPVSRIAVAESLSNGAALSVGASSEDWSDF
jgi:methyl-accepting chemotaxis protein